MGRSVHPRPRHGAIGCKKTAFRQVARARRRPVQPYRSDDMGRHVGAGCGRRPSISRRISANSRRVIPTSASWNVTYRPCRTTLAPVLISFSRCVFSNHCSTSSGKASVRRLGSPTLSAASPIIRSIGSTSFCRGVTLQPERDWLASPAAEQAHRTVSVVLSHALTVVANLHCGIFHSNISPNVCTEGFKMGMVRYKR